MSIRRIGGFNPSASVQTAQLIDAQRRVEAVEKHIGADDPELMTEEQKLEALNAHLQAELEAMEAERAAKEQASTQLRSQLMNVDGFERTPRGELLDLKGGAEEGEPRALAGTGQGGVGVSLAQLARAHVYAAARAQSAAEEAVAVASAQHQAEVAAPAEDDWMQAELAALQSEVEGAGEVEESEETYSDPGADSFFASLEDIENLEEGGANFVDPGADAFVASLDDIAHLMSEAGEEAASPVNAEGLLEAPPTVVVDAFEAAPAPAMLPFDDEDGSGTRG